MIASTSYLITCNCFALVERATNCAEQGKLLLLAEACFKPVTVLRCVLLPAAHLMTSIAAVQIPLDLRLDLSAGFACFHHCDIPPSPSHAVH